MARSRLRLLLADQGLDLTIDDLVFPPELSYGRNEHYIKVFIMAYVKLLCDSPLETKPKEVALRYLRSLLSHDIKDTVKFHASLFDSLVKTTFETGNDSSLREFDCRFQKTPVFREYLKWFRTGDPSILRYLFTFLRFGKKAKYEDPSFDATAFREWQGVEERLENLTFSPQDLANLRTIVRVILPRLDMSVVLPHFSGGRVMERGVKDVWDKLNTLTLDRKLSYTFRDGSFFASDSSFGINFVPHRTVSDSPPSRLKFVPKDITKSRSICMEPNGYMYLQQEVKRALYRAFEDGLISRFVHLDDQSKNREAALHGSTYLSSDTLDLSSASDSVHIDLVRGIFPPDYLYYLLGTRSDTVIVPDHSQPIKVKKFAPMGSACCFPVQCVVFSAISILGYILTDRGLNTSDEVILDADGVEFFLNSRLHRVRNESTPFTRRLEPPLVYGDDIVCDSRCTDVIVPLLQKLGFQVNLQKSFTGSQAFRESCGVFCMSGYDVTPYHYTIPFFNERGLDAGIYAGFIEAINNLRAANLCGVATFLTHVLENKMPYGRLPFKTDPDGFGILTRNKRPVPDTALRWNAGWQIFEERTLGIVPRFDGKRLKPEALDNYQLVQWWRTRSRGGIGSPFGESLRIRPQETRLAPVWSRCE